PLRGRRAPAHDLPAQPAGPGGIERRRILPAAQGLHCLGRPREICRLALPAVAAGCRCAGGDGQELPPAGPAENGRPDHRRAEAQLSGSPVPAQSEPLAEASFVGVAADSVDERALNFKRFTRPGLGTPISPPLLGFAALSPTYDLPSNVFLLAP